MSSKSLLRLAFECVSPAAIGAWSDGSWINKVDDSSNTDEMAIGTTRYFPLGISTEDRWGAARRRRLMAICAVCALVAAGFAIVGKARLITMKPVDAGLRPGTSESPVEPPGAWYKTEGPDQAQVVTEVAIAPLAATVSPSTAAQMDSPTGSTPALAPQPPSPPTILRGAGTKPH
jgi:hypothetical protein